MKKWAESWNQFHWGAEFWLFTVRYYVPPWHGWKTSLSMKNADGKPLNLFLRVSNVINNYVHAAIVAVVLLLLVKNLVEANWIGVAALLAITPPVVAVLLFRLQAPFRLGSIHQRIGNDHAA